MEKWQKFVLEHGHIGAEVVSADQMLFPNFYGDQLMVTLVRLPNGKVEEYHGGGNPPTIYDNIKSWLGYE